MNTRNIRFKSNRVRDIINLYHAELDQLYGSGEVDMFVLMLFEDFLGWDRVRMLLGKEQTIDQSDLLRFHWALEDLKRHRPIQHIIGHVDFCGCRIEVGPDVLIPRPETEEIVSWCIANANFSDSRPSIVDLCTGSGCIAIALKKAFPHSDVTAVDLSEAALNVARRNAKANGVEINFMQADVLSPDFALPASSYSLVISNPPYVLDSERSAMQRNVLDYDPPQALFVPDSNPLLFYQAIAAIANRSLAPDGMLVVEINKEFPDEICELFSKYGFSHVVHRDFRNLPRWITCKANQAEQPQKQNDSYHV